VDGQHATTQAFFDGDAKRYRAARYDGEAGPQLPYRLRRTIALQLAGSGPGVALDVGCGPGIFSEELSRRGFGVQSVDFSPNMLKATRERAVDQQWDAHVTAADAVKLPFRGGTFDLVMCIGLVAYVTELHVLLGELARVLRPGGTLVVQTSNRCALTSRVDTLMRLMHRRFGRGDGFGGVLRTYSPKQFRRALIAAGFQPQAQRFYDFRPPLLDRLVPSLSARLGVGLQCLETARLAPMLGEGFVVKAATRP
jgi:ubiquinone/menaquinone biosynthesis C-methylase UbiE